MICRIEHNEGFELTIQILEAEKTMEVTEVHYKGYEIFSPELISILNNEFNANGFDHSFDSIMRYGVRI